MKNLSYRAYFSILFSRAVFRDSGHDYWLATRSTNHCTISPFVFGDAFPVLQNKLYYMYSKYIVLFHK